jgi:prephenate dehydrogenase
MSSEARPFYDSNVCIVGLGLMGGSLALALRQYVASIAAVDTHPATCRRAIDMGIADRVSLNLSLAGEADLILLATPVLTLVRQIGELASIAKPGAVIIDIGSVKKPVTEAMDALPEDIEAVGGHPMCGKSAAGLPNADPALFQGAVFVLCHSRRTSDRAFKLGYDMAAAIGARPKEMDSTHHDQVVAAISGLPYTLASSLAKVVTEQGKTDLDIWALAASGFRDTSRLAGTDPAMMTDILLANKKAILKNIKAVQTALTDLAKSIKADDAESVRAWVEDAQASYRVWESENSSR